MNRITLRVPAKINLFLHITGRYDNGYHKIESIFCPINWFDELSLETNNSSEINRFGGLQKVLPNNDLVVRAVKKILSKEANTPEHLLTQGVNIALKKNIPDGAGMGGGSADAAYTMLALQELLPELKKTCSKQTLHTLGSSLGADIPFFIGQKGQCQTAFVEGIGEQITPLELPEIPLVIIKPPNNLSTKRIFSHPDLTRDHDSVKIRIFGFSDTCDLFSFIKNHCKNDLELVASTLCPQIKEGLALFDCLALELKPVFSRMTGSGSAVFAVYSTTNQANKAAQEIRRLIATPEKKAWQVKACKTLSFVNMKNLMVR